MLARPLRPQVAQCRRRTSGLKLFGDTQEDVRLATGQAADAEVGRDPVRGLRCPFLPRAEDVMAVSPGQRSSAQVMRGSTNVAKRNEVTTPN